MRSAWPVVLFLMVILGTLVAFYFGRAGVENARSATPGTTVETAPAGRDSAAVPSDEPGTRVEPEPSTEPFQGTAEQSEGTAEEARLAESGPFEPVGLGGGGAMYTPTSSPHDPNLMFVNCDMSGSYRSADGGRTWQMIDFRQTRSSTVCKAAFHRTDPSIIYFKNLVSRDGGVTWDVLDTDAPFRSGDVVEIATDPVDPDAVIIGTGNGVFVSRNGGADWVRSEGLEGRVAGIYVDPREEVEQGRIYVATDKGVFRSVDGSVFEKKTGGLPWDEGIRDMAGGLDPEGNVTLYCTIPSRNLDGEYGGGVFRSDNGGDEWYSVMGEGINTQLGRVDRYGAGEIPEYFLLGVASGNADLVYVTGRGTGYWPPHHSTVYKSSDGGRTWHFTYNRDFRFARYDSVEEGKLNVDNGWIPYALSWIWGGFHTGNGFHVNPAHPEVLMWTDGGTLDISLDGGQSWRGAYSSYAPGQAPPTPEPGRNPGFWQSVGLEVTSTWEYHVDPFDHKRHYICYTDVGFAISTDGGTSWLNNTRSSGTPWTNTTYMIRFDPDRKGRMWAAMSNVHDIPHWTYIHDQVDGPGGVCISNDHGAHWTVTSEGLPNAPCTSIALDTRSPIESRTLYVTMYNHGVFKSTDDGRTWTPANNGIELQKNNHTFLVRIHPDGTLFCCVTARRVGGRGSHNFPEPGALYRSTDGGKSWQNITRSQSLHWPNGFDFHPQDSDIIYLAAGTIPRGREGGIYKTSDGGATWARLLRDEDFEGKGGPSYVHGMFVTVDPIHPDVVYLGTGTHGLWWSEDAGRTWRQFEFIPFGNAHRVAFDPDDHGRIYVTTFGGGVWRGRSPSP